MTARATEEQAVVGVQPAFPSGADYDVLIASLPGLGLLLDTNGNGQLNDEYFDTNGEANLGIVGGTLGTLVAAGTLCGAVPPIPLPPPIPLNAKEACYAGLTVAALALQSNAIAMVQCSTQDSFVDNAQAEAAFENTTILIASGLERNLRQCQRLVGLRLPEAFGGRAEEVRNLVEFRIQQFEAAGGNSN